MERPGAVVGPGGLCQRGPVGALYGLYGARGGERPGPGPPSGRGTVISVDCWLAEPESAVCRASERTVRAPPRRQSASAAGAVRALALALALAGRLLSKVWEKRFTEHQDGVGGCQQPSSRECGASIDGTVVFLPGLVDAMGADALGVACAGLTWVGVRGRLGRRFRSPARRQRSR